MENLDLAIEHCRILAAHQVAERLNINKARQLNKWSCPSCGSSDAFHVYPEAGRGSHCFSCWESMDAIDLVQSVTGLEFKVAVKWLADEFGFADLLSGHTDFSAVRKRKAEIRKKIERGRAQKAIRTKKRRDNAVSIFKKMFYMIDLGPSGCDYLESRGIPYEVAFAFGMSSVEDDSQWDKIRKNFWVDELEAAGLTGRNDRGTFPVPWRTPFLVIPYVKGGEIDLLRFRDLTGNKPKYLSPLGHKPLSPYLSWNAYDFADTHETLYVCEGEINAISVTYSGAPAVGACGTGTWKPEWSKDFRWYKRVVILCDGDEAGVEFSKRVYKSTCKALGKDWARQHLTRRKFAKNLDANDALQSGALQGLLNAA